MHRIVEKSTKEICQSEIFSKSWLLSSATVTCFLSGTADSQQQPRDHLGTFWVQATSLRPSLSLSLSLCKPNVQCPAHLLAVHRGGELEATSYQLVWHCNCWKHSGRSVAITDCHVRHQFSMHVYLQEIAWNFLKQAGGRIHATHYRNLRFQWHISEGLNCSRT